MQTARRWAWIVLAADVGVLAVLGIWLAFRYTPGGNALSGLHNVLGGIAVLAALVAAGTTVADDERSTAGVLPAVVVLAVIAGMYLTGPSLKWDRFESTTPVGPRHGIAVLFDKHVGAVTDGNHRTEAATYRRLAWLHTAALPFALVVMGSAGVWAVRAHRRYVPTHADEDVV